MKELPEHPRVPSLEHRTRLAMGELARDLSIEIRLAFEHEVRSMLKDNQTLPLSEHLREAFLMRPLMPLIEVHDTPTDIRARASDLGLEDVAKRLWRDEALLVVHLPNLLRQYELRSRNMNRDNVLGALEPLYRSGIEALWNTVRQFEVQHSVNVHRLNGLSQHHDGVDGYYYVFVIAPHHRKTPILTEQEMLQHVQPREDEDWDT